ncbi:MAG: 4-hydroxy-tetrahydrodipicolinate synthase [Bacteroidia bacterium]|nr:4-hydroxy-tetrahydrodipicolinate synthase [Bacteroidia bacterium]
MISRKKLKGTGVALITPFQKDGGIDFRSFEKLLKHVISNKVEFLVVQGTTAESATLSSDEKNALLDFVIEINAGRLPVVLGIGGNNTQGVVKELRNKDLTNVDAILSVSPYYNKPSQRGIYQHFKMIANASPKPIILYNVPSRTSSNISADTCLSLANDFNNIIGVKEASGDLGQCMTIIKNKPSNFLVLSGDDQLTLPLIACGGDGVISVVANTRPKEFSEMVRQSLAGNYTKARNLHYKVNELIDLLFIEGNPAGVKASLDLMGICQDHLRLPLVSMSKANKNKIKACLDELA